MTRPMTEVDDGALRAIGDAVRAEIDGETSAFDHTLARARMLERLQTETEQTGAEPQAEQRRTFALFGARFRMARTIWVGASTLAVAAVIAIVVSLARASSRPLGFSVDGQAAGPGAMVRAGASSLEVRFDDGSDIVFGPGATGRIAEVSSRGARVVVAEGHAHFRIEHRADTAWSVEAGPYVVRVTGTEFDLDWTPATSSLRVAMVHGSVAVEGAVAPVPSLVTGYTLDVDSKGKLAIRANDLASVASATVDSAAAHPLPDAPAVASSASVALAPAPVETTSARAPDREHAPEASRAPWSKTLELGKYDVIVREASALGVDNVMKTASLDDLVALSEAARYSGHGDLAGQTLGAVRTRFPESPAAHTATFLLGRIAEEGGSTARAVSLYDEYLASGGAFSEEALGRKMMVVRASGGQAAAAPVAREYLSRFPKGAFSKAASAIAEQP